MSVAKRFFMAAVFCLCAAAFSLCSPAAFAQEDDPVRPDDLSIFSLKNGKFHISGAEVPAEVNEVPADVEGPLRVWSAFEGENETGVWFFAENGECLTFLPLESESECQGIVFSPNEERLLLARGSAMRPDLTWELYETGAMEFKEEISGWRENVEWIDPVRFVMTRIDDIREGDNFSQPAYGFRVSVVMYDAAASELTVLKEATDTKNYWITSVGDGVVTVWEDSVKSEKDWGDEDKIEGREITVEIQATK